MNEKELRQCIVYRQSRNAIFQAFILGTMTPLACKALLSVASYAQGFIVLVAIAAVFYTLTRLVNEAYLYVLDGVCESVSAIGRQINQQIAAKKGKAND